MTDEQIEDIPMAECGACRTVIPLDSTECPSCQTKFSGVSDEALGECGACNKLVPLDSTRCPECGVVFIADDVVDILRTWVHDTGINIRKLFDKFDENSDGTIDSGELKRGLLSLNLADLPPSQVDRLVAEIDADGNGVIDLDEFDQILMGESDATVEAVQAHEVTEDVDEEETEAEHPDDDEDASPGDDEADEEQAVEMSGEDPVEEDEGEPADDSAFTDEEEDFEEDVGDDEVSSVDDQHHDEDNLEDAVDEPFEGTRSQSPLAALADMMDERGISAQRLFNDLDVDGNGSISMAELASVLTEKYGDVIEVDDIETLLADVDEDGDGNIDITEFFASLEELEDHEEALAEHEEPVVKEFPTPWQSRMMSKTWNDNIWPIIHVGFGILIVLVLVNAMLGPVDGTGGTVLYDPVDEFNTPRENGFPIYNISKPYPCAEDLQVGGCSNSLTPFAGIDGASSMPKGFYWDGILLLVFALAGICSSLFLHLVKAPAWRARARAMKEFSDDKADAEAAAESEENEDEYEEDEILIEDDLEDLESESENEAPEDAELNYDENADDAEEFDDGEGEAESEDVDDGEIDVGSHIGLMFDGEEVFGTILEFDDDEGTVTIEEDGTGDLVTGYQEDMFVE